MPDEILIRTEIKAADNSSFNQKLYLMGIYNTQTLSESESMKMASETAMAVIDQYNDGYHFTSVQVNYADCNGMYEISVDNRSDKVLTKEILFKHTRKKTQNELSEEYLNWVKGI